MKRIFWHLVVNTLLILAVRKLKTGDRRRETVQVVNRFEDLDVWKEGMGPDDEIYRFKEIRTRILSVF
jgi:hypothetical protein